MTTKPKTTKTAKQLDSVSVLNTVRDELGGQYADQVPKAIRSGDTLSNGRIATHNDALMQLRGIGNVLMDYEPLRNAFLNALVNRIARVIITSRLYQNPWSGFKKGFLEYGETVEEIFVQIAKPYQFDPEKAETEVFKRRIPDVKSAFHSMNYQKYYPTTVSHDQLKQAFLSFEGVTDLISRIIEQVYTGANYDEFLVMKYLIARVALDGEIYPVNIDTATADNARAITTEMVNYAKKLGFMSSQYNYAGVPTYTDISSLYIILTTDISSLFDVEVLALSFNMNKAELLGRQVEVDGFGTFDTDRLALIFVDDPYTNYVPFEEDDLTQLAQLKALMVDIDWFMIFDNFQNMTEIYNPQGLYWNYFYHVWKTFSISPFSNAIAFTEGTPAVNSVTVSPTSQTTGKGTTVQLNAVVDTTGFASKTVTWSIQEAVTDSSVNEKGLVTIGANETQTTITVKATSDFNAEKSGQCVITVQSA